MTTYVRRNGEKLGPFEDAQLLSSLQQGMFSYDDLALRDGWTDWKPLRTLFAPPGTVPPVARPAAETASSSAEQLMWSGRASHWNFLFSWLLAFLFVGAGALCVWIYFNGGTSALLLVPGAIGIRLLLYIYISRVRQRYIVTNRKVEIQTGLVVKSSNEIRVKGTVSLWTRFGSNIVDRRRFSKVMANMSSHGHFNTCQSKPTLTQSAIKSR